MIQNRDFADDNRRTESEKRSPASPASKPVRRRATLRKIGAAIAWFAGVGAILGGLAGYWSMYRTVTTELLAPATSKPRRQSR